jgi:hypothetical protein
MRHLTEFFHVSENDYILRHIVPVLRIMKDPKTYLEPNEIRWARDNLDLLDESLYEHYRVIDQDSILARMNECSFLTLYLKNLKQQFAEYELFRNQIRESKASEDAKMYISNLYNEINALKARIEKLETK